MHFVQEKEEVDGVLNFDVNWLGFLVRMEELCDLSVICRGNG